MTRLCKFFTDRMKILLIAHACQVRHEGQQRAQQLGRLPDIDLRVITPDRWYEYGAWRKLQPPIDPTYTLQAEPVRFPWSGPAQWYFHHYPNLGETLRTFQPDIINIWEEAWGLVSVHTCWLRNRLLPSAKIVSETEANIPRTHPFPFKQFRSYTLKNSDYFVARQTEGVEVLRVKGYTGPVDVIGNAVDAELFRPMDREACKRALGVSGFVAGYVGRLIEAKGLMDIIEALPKAPGVTMVFVGSGEFQGALEKRISELGLTERVRFFPPRKMEALPEVMNALDALLLVSRTTATWKEQFGRVIIEAHACETPVIGSDSGAISEVIDRGGLTVREGNSDDIAAAIRQLKDNPEMAREMGRAGRAQVEQLYTWKRVSERMRDIYLKVLGKKEAVSGAA
jgi:glycosyltransferase involved in cell wall biosynthesis